ncbi:hypothetical protein C0991_008284 [Blastosporella zonata]|nr:hypothetical protein C0991_008284 [Blastosporella zonata]
MTVPSMLDTVPQEVLEHIAFFSATNTLLGPPSGIVPLLLINRGVYSRLSISTNYHLYARIHVYKFDVKSVIGRLGPHSPTSYILATELPRRFRNLKRIRDRLDCLAPKDNPDDNPVLEDLIPFAYILMLENEGKNEQQLRNYGVDVWLRDYWFHKQGASRVAEYLLRDEWLPETPIRSMAMWTFWFLFNPGKYNLPSSLAGSPEHTRR